MKHRDSIIKFREQGLSYSEIVAATGCSKSTVSFHCKGTKKQVRSSSKKKVKSSNKKCLFCEKNIIVTYKHKNKKYCNAICFGKHYNLKKYDAFIEKWKKGLVDGGRGVLNGHNSVSSHIRKYLFYKYANGCAKCNWSEVNKFTNTIPLEIEHIDGDSLNNKESNLTLLCPNCHSLTAGHSTSKGNGRRYYRERYHNNKVG